MKHSTLRICSFVFLLGALASCGGGSNSEKSSQVIPSDVTIYGSCGNTPNYKNEILISRWKRFPITLYVDLSNAPGVDIGNNRSIYRNAILYSANNWSSAGNGIGAIILVSTPDADIVVRFGSTPTADSFGSTSVVFDGNYKKKATINLNLQKFSTLSQTIYLDYWLKITTTHEMGHVLMAYGHPVSTRNSVMFQGSSIEGPTLEDLNTIREAYCRVDSQSYPNP
ncbi:hypothetical protein [Undibacterium sp. TJN19]|uniref:hypothetical protein n=1 Tax=Undibacterium sp. TJN19 TaxID=3413055 RepID=UPI003BF15653